MYGSNFYGSDVTYVHITDNNITNKTSRIFFWDFVQILTWIKNKIEGKYFDPTLAELK